MNNIRKAQTSYYVSLCMLTTAKTLPHAVLTILLFAKGLNLSQILFIQTIFNGVVFCSEFPSGIMSDLYSRKIIFLCANIAMMSTCLLVLYTNGFIFMAIAWGFYGLSEALNSGTIDASLINLYKQKSSNYIEDITKFKKKTNQLQLISMIIGATSGFYLYLWIGTDIYALSLTLIFLSTIIIASGFPQDKKNTSDRHGAYTQIFNGWKELKKDRRLKYLIAFSAVSQIFFTMHYNLWQAYTLSIGFSKNSFLWFYLLFQVIGIVSFQIPISNIKRATITIGGLTSVIAPFLILSNNNSISIIAYCISVFCFTFLQYLYDVLFSLYVSEERISTLTTINSTISRVTGIITLSVSGILISLISIKALITASFELAVAGSLVLAYTFIHRNKKHPDTHTSSVR